MEANGLTGILDEIDQFSVPDEVAHEDTFFQFVLQLGETSLSCALNFLDLTNPTKGNFSCQEVASLLWIKRLDIFF